MGGKQMEGDNVERRRKAKEAREHGKRASEDQVSTGASKQRERRHDEEHVEKLEKIREGKQEVIAQTSPEARPRSGPEKIRGGKP